MTNRVPTFPSIRKRRPGIYLESELLASPAFAELNRTEIRVLLRFYQKRQIAKKRKGQKVRSKEILNNGQISFTYNEANDMGISDSAFTRAIDGLLERGFIDITHSGEGMYRSVSLYAISTRWGRYGTEAFQQKTRRRRSRRVGFLREHGKS